MQDYWNDSPNVDKGRLRVPDDIADLSFRVECHGGLVVDHAYQLYQEISRILPWFAEQPSVALHTLHGAESGNGWVRPYKDGALLFLSKRTRLRLRLTKSRFSDAALLAGHTLTIGDCKVDIKPPTIRALSSQTTLFCRSLVSANDQDENGFLHYATTLLNAKGIHPRQMMGGRRHTIKTPDKTFHARSLMIVDLSFEESILLQQSGLGTEQKLGCGVFLPHKSIGNPADKS